MTQRPTPLLTTITLGSVIIIALILGILPIYFNHFALTTPDAGGLACAAQILADTGQFNPGRTSSPNFAICWTKEHYPVVQIINAMILKLTPLASWQTVPITGLVMYLGCVIGMFWILLTLTRSLTPAVVAGILTAATPSLLRSLILTPQNVYGYFVIIIMLLSLIRLVQQPRRWWWWIILIILTPLLAFTHTLSFGIAAIALAIWFWLFFLESWWYRLGVAGIVSVIILVNERLSLLPVGLQSAWSLFRNSFSGYDHPIWDHPAIWGYVITALAAIGLALTTKLNYKVRWLWVSLIIVPVTLGHLSYFGLQLLPERFIPFAWLGLVPLAALGVTEIQHRLHWQPAVWMATLTIIIGAQLVHGVVFIQDDINGWSARFRPKPEFIQAMQWLNTQPEAGKLLGIMAVSNREISFAPLWYRGNIENYPWYNLDHKNIQNLTAGSSFYTPIMADPTHPEYKRVHALYNLITNPIDPTLPTQLAPYQLQYFILPKTSQAYKLWQTYPEVPFRQIYTNSKYVIYALN